MSSYPVDRYRLVCSEHGTILEFSSNGTLEAQAKTQRAWETHVRVAKNTRPPDTALEMAYPTWLPDEPRHKPAAAKATPPPAEPEPAKNKWSKRKIVL